MNVKATELDTMLEEVGVPEKEYGVLVTGIYHDGTYEICVNVIARADVVAATIARNVYYTTCGMPTVGIHTAAMVIDSMIRDDFGRLLPQGAMRMGV